MDKIKNLNELVGKYVVCNKHRGSPRFFDVLTGYDCESAIFCDIKEATKEAKRYWDDTYASIFYVDELLNVYRAFDDEKRLKYKAFQEYLIDVEDVDYHLVYAYDGKFIGTIYMTLFRFDKNYQSKIKDSPKFFKNNVYPCLKYADFVKTSSEYFLNLYQRQSENSIQLTKTNGERIVLRGFFREEDKIHGFEGNCNLTKQAIACGRFIENKIKVL